jgi:TrmH family RNA methyltransferase
VLSAKSDRVKRLRRLVRQRQARSQERAFVAQGPVLVAEALMTPGLDVLEIFSESPVDARVMAAAAESGRRSELVAPGGLRSVLDTVTPQPVCAVVRTPQTALDDVATSGPLLVLVELRDPGNMGTLMRTAEAAGAAALVVIGDAVDPTNPKVVRAAAGARFRLPVVDFGDTTTAFAAIRATGRAVVATVVGDADGVIDYDAADLTRAALVLGNEAHGLSSEDAAAADLRVTIPLAGPTESLNVAAAGAVVCFESLRQRRHA